MVPNKRRVLNLNNHPHLLCLSWEVISLGFHCMRGWGGGWGRRRGLDAKMGQAGVPICFSQLSQLCCGHWADICWELSCDITGVRALLTWLCAGYSLSCFAKPLAQGHTANKMLWDLRSHTWDQNPGFTCVMRVKSLSIFLGPCFLIYEMGTTVNPSSQWRVVAITTQHMLF